MLFVRGTHELQKRRTQVKEGKRFPIQKLEKTIVGVCILISK